MAAGVVALPEASHGDLAADIPDLQVHIGQGDSRDILPDGWNSLAGVWGRGAFGTGEEESFDLGEEGGFAGIIQAEEEDGVF